MLCGKTGFRTKIISLKNVNLDCAFILLMNDNSKLFLSFANRLVGLNLIGYIKCKENELLS